MSIISPEQSLIEEVKLSKSEKAFHELYFPYEAEIINFLKSRAYSSGIDHLEIYNQALLKVWSNIPTFQGKSSFKTWFFQIAKNTMYDEYNKAKKRYSRDVELCESLPLNHSAMIDYESPIKIIFDEEQKDAILLKIQSLKGKLAKKHLDIFELIFEQGKSYKEASKILDCSLGTVMSRVFHTRKKLKAAIKNHEYSKIN